MNGFFDNLMGSDLVNATAGGPQAILLVLLLAFCIGHIVAWVYMWTHSGMSYSQMFTSSLLVMPVLVALVTAVLLLLSDYTGYAALSFAVGASAAINLT